MTESTKRVRAFKFNIHVTCYTTQYKQSGFITSTRPPRDGTMTIEREGGEEGQGHGGTTRKGDGLSCPSSKIVCFLFYFGYIILTTLRRKPLFDSRRAPPPSPPSFPCSRRGRLVTHHYHHHHHATMTEREGGRGHGGATTRGRDGPSCPSPKIVCFFYLFWLYYYIMQKFPYTTATTFHPSPVETSQNTNG